MAGKGKILDKDLELTDDEIKEMEDHLEGLHLDNEEGIHSLMLAYVQYNQVSGQWDVYSDNGTLIKPYPDKRSALKKKYQLEWYARVRAQQGKLVPNEISTVSTGQKPPAPPAKDTSTVTQGWKSPNTQYRDSWNTGTGDAKQPLTSQEEAEKQLKALAKQTRQPHLIKPANQKNVAETEKPPQDEGIYKPDITGYNNNMKQLVTDVKQPVTEKSGNPNNSAPSSGPIQPMIEETGKIKETVTLFRDGEWDFSKEMNLKFKVDNKFKKSILDNFVNNVRGQRIPIVDRHDPMNKAYGWIVNIWETDYGLEAKPSYNPRGIQALENEEYGYHSPQVDFDYYDPETKKSYGPTLLELTLTNGPRIKRSSSVLKGFSESVNKEGGNKMDPKEQMKKLLADLMALMEQHPEAVDKQDTVAFTEMVKKAEETVPVKALEKAPEADTKLQALEAQIKQIQESIAKKEATKAEVIEEPVQKEEIVDKVEAVLVASETTPEKKEDYASEVEKEKLYLSELNQLRQVVDDMGKRLELSEAQRLQAEQEKVKIAEERNGEKLNVYLSELEEKGIIKPLHKEEYKEFFMDLQEIDRKNTPGTFKLSEGTTKAQGMENRFKALLSESKQVWTPKEIGTSPIPDVGKTNEDILTEKALALSKTEKISLSEAIGRLNKELKVSFVPKDKERGSF